MSLNHQELPLDNIGQSPGCDPKSAKRNSGLFAFFKWFKPSSTSRESIDTVNSSSCDSLNSIHSNGTVASFSYVPPSAYAHNRIIEKCIVAGPETDTYKARLKQRDKRRENDKNLTLRKKYNLFFNRETLLKSLKASNKLEVDEEEEEEEENTKSLPLMTRTTMDETEEKMHRRTNSESSKIKRAGAYLHVKGKRRAPQPPPAGLKQLNDSTLSLRRKKRLAPAPPAQLTNEKILNGLNEYGTIEYADADIIFNDSLKLDHGILKPLTKNNSPNTSARSSFVEAPVSPRPWYKRNSAQKKTDDKYEPVERQPQEVQFIRNSTTDLTNENSKKVEDKRKSSGLSFLTNISELDREASEIVKKEHVKSGNLQEMPHFMRPKEEPTKTSGDSWVSPKRRSARDLIAKFNAITSVTKVTVNSAFFGSSQKDSANSKRDYFGKQVSLNEEKKGQESLLENHKKRLQQIDNKNKLLIKDDTSKKFNNLIKSESASAIKSNKPETPKIERKSWYCPKCSIENDYWRIICHVCSTIKPYFDDLTSTPPPTKTTNKEVVDNSNKEVASVETGKETKNKTTSPEKLFERSKTQIGFSVLASYNANRNKKIEKSVSLDESKKQSTDNNKKEEREKLKKMLIEMKNSLPKRKPNVLIKQNSRSSVIMENPEIAESEETEKKPKTEVLGNDNNKKELEAVVGKVAKTQEEKVASVLVGTTETIYENIKVRKSDNPKPVKVSASAQTSSVITKTQQLPTKTSNNYEPMKPKDFENIYSDTNGQSPARIYANLAQNDELSLFFNMPKSFNEIKNIGKNVADNTDTIEINRLLKRLESAIAKGELTQASIYAKELAQLKINCSVIRQKPATQQSGKKKQGFTIEMFVEDKISHRGPFPIEVTANQTVAELKLQVQNEFDIPVNVQRWILGKELASEDNTSLKDHNITEGCPVFLYLVAPPEPKALEAKVNIKTRDADVPTTSKIVTKSLEELPKSVSGFGKLEVLETNHHQLVAKESNDRSEVGKLAKNEEVVPKVHLPKVVKVIPKVFEDTSAVSSDKKLESNEKKTEMGNEKRLEKVAQKKTSITDIKLEITETKIQLPSHSSAGTSSENSSSQIKTTPTLSNQSTSADADIFLDEDLEDYDTKTLKPQPKEWECGLCTLLNPTSSNICAVCSAVRVKEDGLVHTPKKSKKTKKAPQPHNNKDQTYLQLVNLDNTDLVENVEPFECVVCFMEIAPGHGVTLRECLHQFCKLCLAQSVEYTEDAEVKCPYRDEDYSCNIALQDREIKALVTPVVYEQYLAKSVAQAENKIGKSFHCKTPDCKGWCIFEDNVNEFRCPVCRKVNCLTCQAIHVGLNCKQYQERMNEECEVDEDAKRTKKMLEEMVSKGEALTCPTCQVILMKKWGCDWLRCSMCKTEICWVTRGPRWGLAGKGDTSGGCQCGVNGVKCHPQCNYCH